MKNITFGFNDDGVYARVGDRIAFTVLDYGNMKPENGFAAEYNIEDDDAATVLRHSEDILWTKKIPVAVKNAFRAHFGMKPLKDDGKPVLWGGMTRAQYLCKRARDVAKARGHDLKPFKKLANWCGSKFSYQGICKTCGKEVHVNPEPEPNEIDIGGDAIGDNCKGW